MMEGLFQFTKAYPAQCKDGWPLNWRRYVQGLRHLGREVARSNLMAFEAQVMSSGLAKTHVLQRWVARQSSIAEWR